MNERIKEMAIQLGYLRWDVDSESYEVHGDVDTLDSFVKLIVKECLDILDDEDDGGYEGRSVRIAMIRLKEHFGVKE